jgi:hypothetical protein
MPYTLCPIPYILCPTPYTLHPTPYSDGEQCDEAGNAVIGGYSSSGAVSKVRVAATPYSPFSSRSGPSDPSESLWGASTKHNMSPAVGKGAVGMGAVGAVGAGGGGKGPTTGTMRRTCDSAFLQDLFSDDEEHAPYAPSPTNNRLASVSSQGGKGNPPKSAPTPKSNSNRSPDSCSDESLRLDDIDIAPTWRPKYVYRLYNRVLYVPSCSIVFHRVPSSLCSCQPSAIYSHPYSVLPCFYASLPTSTHPPTHPHYRLVRLLTDSGVDESLLRQVAVQLKLRTTTDTSDTDSFFSENLSIDRIERKLTRCTERLTPHAALSSLYSVLPFAQNNVKGTIVVCDAIR